MTKVKKAIKFTGKIDLTEWVMPKTENLVDDVCYNIHEKISNEIEKELEKVKKAIGDYTDFARQIASEALTISFEKGVSAHFWDIGSEPELITINFEDFNEDGFYCELNLKEAVKEAILNHCEKDGYIDEDYKKEIECFAQMLRDCAHIVETSIRPESNK